MSLQQRHAWFRIENSSTARCTRVLVGELLRTGRPQERACPGLPLLDTSEPPHPAVMETYKHFNHRPAQDRAIWQGWFQDVPEVCTNAAPGVKEDRLRENSMTVQNRKGNVRLRARLSLVTLGWEVSGTIQTLEKAVNDQGPGFERT